MAMTMVTNLVNNSLRYGLKMPEPLLAASRWTLPERPTDFLRPPQDNTNITFNLEDFKGFIGAVFQGYKNLFTTGSFEVHPLKSAKPHRIPHPLHVKPYHTHHHAFLNHDHYTLAQAKLDVVDAAHQNIGSFQHHW